ncbi:hypothetical protein IGI04_026464 [Brassica rapa subsp. trilocularis]|uniref:Zinc finger GRF-type domain-containing protein n=1 Tax=Brassica rapa subsp. trilocularis TaxID=1813537 RepID=A0ABQ7KW56_BRACM|nr:hypothetical protein IGI04_026464 [Brassica rapa subsp. trilocularis]
MKKDDLLMKERLTKLAILDTLLAKNQPLTEAEEIEMGRYSYSQPSLSEDYCGDSSDGGYSSTEELIRRDQEELIRRDQEELIRGDQEPPQYPPQPEVEFGFPQTCYCGGAPKLATSKTLNDRGRLYFTCDQADDLCIRICNAL